MSVQPSIPGLTNLNFHEGNTKLTGSELCRPAQPFRGHFKRVGDGRWKRDTHRQCIVDEALNTAFLGGVTVTLAEYSP